MDQIINEITDYFVVDNKRQSICDLAENKRQSICDLAENKRQSICDLAENKRQSICDLAESDQLLYYKLVAIVNGEEVDISDDEIIKIKCVKLLFDYRHKKKIRAIDVITTGDYPLLLTKILKNNTFQDNAVNKDLLKYAIEYDRKSCVKVLKSIKEKINEINQLMNVDNCTPIIDLFLNY
jgi:hypothetical protein